ncbi:MAG TPA: rod shape-determining protein MreD [Candidatus Binatus sp.]|nr:rod shape-determining protein MreD [Candidatus Binatus sp.]
MRLILLFAVFAVLGLAIETAVPHLISFRALVPNLIIILAVDLGLRHHGILPAFIAFTMGYATDALAGSHPGLNAFMMTMVFLVSYEISTRLMVANAFVGATLVFFGVIATSLGTIAMANGFNALSDTGPIMPELTLDALISAIVAPIVFAMLATSKRLTGLKARAARE